MDDTVHVGRFEAGPIRIDLTATIDPEFQPSEILRVIGEMFIRSYEADRLLFRKIVSRVEE